MRKQRKRLYAALLCSSIVLSLVSTPVSAAETGQLTNPPTSTEGPGSPESTSGNEAAAMLNGLYTTLSITNGEAEVTTASELTGALADSSISRITLKGDIDIGSTLTVNRTVTLDLNGCVLKMTGSDSVIKVASDGDLTIQDRNTTTQHKFNPHCKYLTWYIDMWKLDNGGSEIVSGGVITGGGGDQSDGGGVLVAGGTLVMAGGNIVGCSAKSRGGGVYLGKDSDTGKSGTFIMTSGSIIGCAAQLGSGVYVATGCTFTMATGSNIHNCIANNEGGGVKNHGTFKMDGGTISACRTVAFGGGGVCNNGTFIMSDGMIKGCTSPDGQYASGGGVLNTNQFTMTGGTIGDPDNENDASHVYNTSSQKTTLTIRDNAKIYTNVTNVGILNADGGEIAGTMTNDTNRYATGTITGSEGAAGSTEFQGEVTNNGTIRKGTFTNEVINESIGTINGGTFTGTVENRGGTISGGDFSGTTLPVKLMITFEPNNGEPVITQEVNWSKDGAALTAPVPTKEGHSIEGWYYDNNGTDTKWNFDTDKVKCTMTLKAKWELASYFVTLYPNGGTIASGKEVTGYTYGTGAVLPAAEDITREGYRFDGWYADSSFSGSPITEIAAAETGNKTFYAKWTRNTTPIIPGNTINYIVEHYKTDGSGYTLAETEHSAGKTGDTVTATPKTYDGFTYNASLSTASGTLKKISSPEDIVILKLYYDVNTYTVSLDTNGGMITPGKEVTGYTYGTGAVLPAANDLTREGYRFDGWYANNSFSGSPATEITGTDTGDKTFSAKWTRNTTPVTPSGTVRYLVEHYKADGSGYTLAETEHSTGSIGNIITATPKVYEGFTYNAAISTASGTLKKISGPEDIVTLKLYYDVSVYTVTVDGSYAEASGAGHYATKDTVTISAGTRDGYKFSGWTSSDGVTFADAGSATTTFTMPDRAVTVTANWETTDSGSEEKADREAPSPVVKNTPSYVTYTVQAGDTLWAIARKYGCSIAEIVTANSDRIKNPNLIHAGWQLKIPRSGATVTGSTPDAVLPENKKSGTYIVGQGDTLWAIARKCGCSVAEIISLNRELIHDPALIYPGWELKVPQN